MSLFVWEDVMNAMGTMGVRRSLLFLLINTQLITTPAVFANNAQLASGITEKQSSSICPANLESAIDKVVTQAKFSRSRWGILITSLSSHRTLYSRNAQSYFIPASNLKLLTTAAALHTLGSDFRIRTSVYGNANTVRVVGRGDPSLTDLQLKALARQLKLQGKTEITQLLVDDSYFKGSPLNPSWEWEDIQAYYGTSINSLILNENAAVLTLTPQALGQPLKVTWADPLNAITWQLKNDSITTEATSASTADAGYIFGSAIINIHGQLPINANPKIVAVSIIDPATQFLRQFQRYLRMEGITVKAGLVTSQPPQEPQELAFIESPTLANLVMETNQNSNNVYAESLLRSLGVKTANSAMFKSSIEAGINAVKKSLTELGVNPESYIQNDGSGLSRHNLVSPEALTQTLTGMAQTKEASIYKNSLPIAGVSGTLKRRFVNTPAQGIVHAKTGTMSGMSSISGYIDVAGYEPLVFSIIINDSEQSVATIRQAIDEIVLLLTKLHSC